MKATIGSLIVAGIALTGWAGSSLAAPVVADFKGPGGFFDTLVIDLGGGLEVTVSASTHNTGAAGDAPFPPGPAGPSILNQGTEGLGVTTLSAGMADNFELDGSGASESLQFTFNQTVTLLSVIFETVEDNDEHFNGDDQFDMAVDDVDIDVLALLGTEDLNLLPDGGGTGADSNLADFTGDGLTGTVFQFYTTDENDDYRISEFLVEAVANGDTADVPAPPALMLLGLGLAGLGIARRRRC